MKQLVYKLNQFSRIRINIDILPTIGLAIGYDRGIQILFICFYIYIYTHKI
jgi:hypothetical protein